MNNWHRRIWTLDPIPSTDFIAELSQDALTREFWFEPFVATDESALRFRVEFESGAMTANWTACELTPVGTLPYDPDGTVTANTDRLAGTIPVGASTQQITVVINKTVDPEVLTILIGDLTEAGSGVGIATAQNN